LTYTNQHVALAGEVLEMLDCGAWIQKNPGITRCWEEAVDYCVFLTSVRVRFEDRMKYLIGVFFWVCMSLATVAQEEADQRFYLLDSLVLSSYDAEERALVEENLAQYHKAKTLSDQLHYLSQITENSNDYSLWPRYNQVLIEKAKAGLSTTKSVRERQLVKGYLCDALNNKGYILNESGSKEEAKKCFHEAIQLARQLKDEVKLMNCFNNLGQTYSIQGNIPLALKYSFKSLKLAEKLDTQQEHAFLWVP